MLSDLKNKIMSYIPTDYIEKYSKYITNDNIIILCLIIYSSIISMYTPRAIINLINKPVSRIIILGLILYTATYNLILAIFISIAFIITVSIDSSIEINKANLKPIFDLDNGETFEDYNKDNEENEEDETDDEEDDDDEEHKHSKKIKEKFKMDKSEDEEDDEHDYEKDEEDFESSIANNKNLNDQFAQLHSVIHKLEDFVSKKNN